MSQQPTPDRDPNPGGKPPRTALEFRIVPGFDYGTHDWNEMQTTSWHEPLGEKEFPCIRVQIGKGVPASFAMNALNMISLHIRSSTGLGAGPLPLEGVRQWFPGTPAHPGTSGSPGGPGGTSGAG